MEQNRDARKKLLHIWPNDFQQGCQDCAMGKRQSLQQVVLVKLDVHVQNNEVGPFTPCAKINSKWMKDLNYKTLSRTQVKSLNTLEFGKHFLDKTPKAKATK